MAKIDGIEIPVVEIGSHGDKWDKIEELIKDYAKLNPDEMVRQLEAIKYARRVQMNDTASSKAKSLRWGISLPAGLLLLIKKFYPEVFTERREMRKFMRKFRGFTICQKI